jgi:large subunit ribosomal protein L25
MANRVQLKAETRQMLGKKVGRLRRAGILPATVYGHRIEPRSIQINAHEFRAVFRQAGPTQLIDLVIDEGPTRPVLIRQTAIDAKRNVLLHVEFFQANLREKITTHVPVHFVGESPAVADGGTFLPIMTTIDIESLPQDVPAGGIEVDISSITEINGGINAGDLPLPAEITLVTPADETVCKVNAPERETAEEVAAEAEPLPAELGGEPPRPDAVPEA